MKQLELNLESLIRVDCDNSRDKNKFCKYYTPDRIVFCDFLQDNGECFKNLGYPKVHSLVYYKNIK